VTGVLTCILDNENSLKTMENSQINWLCPSCEAEQSQIHKCRICDGLGFLTESEYAHYLKLTTPIKKTNLIPVLELDLSEFDEK